MKIAVTGAMGTGKSTLTAWLASHLPDHEIFNVDTMVAELYADPAFIAALTARFGVAERKAVSQLVFTDKAARAWLETLACEMLEGKLADILARPRIVVEFPLLMEMVAPYARFDVRIATWCDPELQRSRIAARDGEDQEHIERKLAAQMDAQLKAALADIVVDMTNGPDERVLEAITAAKVRVDLKARCTAFFGSTAVWPVLSTFYAAPGRVAHGLDYLAQVLARIDAHREQAGNPTALELAGWFHAAGLSLLPGHYSQSPAHSVRLMWQVLSDAAPHWFDDQENLPLATEMVVSLQGLRVESSRVDANPAWAQDATLFADIIMLAYAAPADVLDKHWADTCAEMQAMPGLRASLPALLLDLASRSRLMTTDEMHSAYESQVRAGIDHLLASVQAPADWTRDFDPDFHAESENNSTVSHEE